MRKLVVLTFLVLLCGCVGRDDYFILNFDDREVAVGYDDVGVLSDDYVFEFVEKRDRKLVSKLVLNVGDLSGPVSLNGYVLGSVESACGQFGGEYSDDISPSCLIKKVVNNRETYVLLRGDLLADDSDVVNVVEVYYDFVVD